MTSPVTEQVLGRCLFREALDQLVSGPGGGGVVGNVDMDEFAPVVSKDQESEEQWKVRVGTTKKSMATISPVCA